MLFIPLMAFLARLCGAKWQPKGFPCEWVWGLAIALLCSNTIEQVIILTVWGYVAMQLGHGNFYGMRGVAALNDQPEKLEQFTRKVYRWSIYEPAYSWSCMGSKGFLIALPLGLAVAAANALLWPLAYYIGFRKLNDGAYAEVLAGGFLGSLIWASL